MGRSTTRSTPFIRPQQLIDDPATTILDLYDWNAVHNSEATLFRYHDGEVVKNISWATSNNATRRAATILASYLPDCSDDSRPVFGIFANAGTWPWMFHASVS